MSSNPQPTISAKASNPSKSVGLSNQSTPSYSQTNAYFGEVLGQRRSGGSGSSNAANSKPSSTPRSNQSAKAKHKQSKKFRLADEDALAESAAMHSTSSRKGQTSITHLMNFSLPPRPQAHQHNSRYASGRPRRNPTWGLGSGYHAVDKARYVHANYRFIVDPRADYRAQRVDADVHIDWNNVLQILVSTESQSSACPICLGTPTAPRMARCGHIFCLPCLIRYMHSEDGSATGVEKKARWKKCPICYDSIYVSETRPVRWYTGAEFEPPREGDDVVLRLIQRPAGSTLAMPRESPDALGKGDDIPWYFAAEVMDYARVMKGGEDYMLAQLDEEIQNVRAMEQEDEVMFGDDTQWTSKAVRALNEAKERIKGIGNPPAAPKKPEEPEPKKPAIQFNQTDEGVPEMYAIQQAIKSGQSLPNGQNGQAESSPSEQEASTRKDDTTTSILSTSLAEFRARQHAERQPDTYFFYQGLLHYYLSSLDIRILKAAFGNYDNFPSSILPRVERVSTGHIVDDDLRKRVKYLGHLPYGCEVSFLECDWTDTVPPAILEQFQGEIDRRRKRNTDKEAREEKERVRAEKAEDREFAAARRRRVSIPSESKFRPDDFVPLSANGGSDAAGSFDGHGSSSSPPWSNSNRPQGSAYASLASPGTSPATSRTVWGTTAIPLTSPELAALQNGNMDDGWLDGWERELSQDDELIAQVQAASLGEGSSSSASRPAPAAKGKKKGKKITLMSTNARRGA
ncbi:hypothetical protein VTO58DRAFT_105058 [Aureobasidium pullulans]|nr:hypothetical protein JADG_000081 [Aureobasidium pullulans]THY97831.1 hypothetical protein D6C95_04861 [Aureobasidium pullulans]TIA66969.1 hypothetical protein D6C76_08959 [Aureobasidium pullulans]